MAAMKKHTTKNWTHFSSAFNDDQDMEEQRITEENQDKDT